MKLSRDSDGNHTFHRVNEGFAPLESLCMVLSSLDIDSSNYSYRDLVKCAQTLVDYAAEATDETGYYVSVSFGDYDADNSTPDSSRHNPAPAYLRELIERSGLSQIKAAHRIGVKRRLMREYLRHDGDTDAPYTVQFALEQLADHSPK